MSTKKNPNQKPAGTTTGGGWDEYKEPPMFPLREGAVIVGVYVGTQSMPEGKYGPWECALLKLTEKAACVTGIGDTAQDYDAQPGEVVMLPVKANLRRILRAFKDDGSRILHVTVGGKASTGDGDNEAWSFIVKSKTVKP